MIIENSYNELGSDSSSKIENSEDDDFFENQLFN